MQIKTVIFDIGQVLVRVHTGGEKFADLMHSVGVKPDEALSRFWLVREIRQLMTGELDPPAVYDFLRQRFAISHSYEEFVEAWCDIFEPIPGMEDVFLRVRERYQVGLLSDTDPLHWEYLRHRFPWLDTVERPTLSFRVGYLKPHPEMFEAAVRNYGRDHHECLFIDDKHDHIVGARWYGMQGIQFTGAPTLERHFKGLNIL